MPIAFVPFSTFAPDADDYGPNLSVAKNLLPVFGSFRTVNQLANLCQVADGPMTAGYCHIYQQARALLFSRPSSDDSVGNWLPETGSTGTLYTEINEVSANDASFIFVAGGPSSQTCRVAIASPGTTSAANWHIRWRYRVPVAGAGTWTMKVELMQSGVVIATDSATGTVASSAWVQRQYDLSGPEMAAITGLPGNPANLFLRFTATVPGSTAQQLVPNSDVSIGSWKDQASGTTNIYTTIDEAAASDADYIQSSFLVAGGAAQTYTAGLSSGVDPITNTGLVWTFRYRAPNAGVTLKGRLKQGTTTIKEITLTNATTSFTTSATTLTPAEAAAITDYTALRAEFEASYPTDAAGTQYQYAYPVADVSNNTWSLSSGGAIWSLIDDPFGAPNDTDFITRSNPGGSTAVVSLTSMTDPLSSYDHMIFCRANVPAGTVFQINLYQGATGIAVGQFTGTGGTVNYTYNLTTTETDSITDYTTLRMQINSGAFGAGSAFVFQTYLQLPQPRQGIVSWAQAQPVSASRGEVSWTEVEVPDGTTTYRGDVPTLFAGSKTKLYTFDQAAFTDISKGGGYSSGTNAAAWSFASWGNDVMATNYVDPVQYRAGNTGSFADMITTPASNKPLARFIAAVRQQVLLAGINQTGHFDDEVWASAVNNNRDFALSLSTQSVAFRVQSQPGQIMGLAGGEFGIVWKRSSMHRLDFVGGATVYRVSDLSASIGTPFPRSIVKAQDKFYFWGGNGFYVTDGTTVQPLGGAISYMLCDPNFSTGALAQIDPTSIAIEDQTMVGAYDPFAGVIVWWYQQQGDSGNYKHMNAVVYNPAEDRWSTINLTGSTFNAYLCTKPNVSNSDTFLTKGLINLGWDGTNSFYSRFSSADTYGATYKTGIITIGLEQQDMDKPTFVRIRNILPVLSVRPASRKLPVTVAVVAARDPYLLNSVTTLAESYVDFSKESGWIPFDNVGGGWFTFQVDVPDLIQTVDGGGIPALVPGMQLSVKGLYVEYELQGPLT